MADDPIWSLAVRFLDLLAMGQEPQIGGHLVRALRNAGQHGQDLRVDLPRIGLPGHRVAFRKADLAADQLVQPPDLGMVAVDQGQEAGLRAGRALGAVGLEVRQAELDLGQVEHEVIGPQAGPLAHRRRLGRLKVREGQAGHGPILLGEAGQAVDHGHQPVADHFQGLAEQHEIGVVGHVAACRAQVDDRPGRGADVAVGMNVGHHVVPQPPLVPFGRREVDVVDVLLQLGDLLLADRQAEFRLGLGQGHPQPPPGAELPLRAPQLAHGGRGIAGDQGVFVLGVLVGHGGSRWLSVVSG